MSCVEAGGGKRCPRCGGARPSQNRRAPQRLYSSLPGKQAIFGPRSMGLGYWYSWGGPVIRGIGRDWVAKKKTTLDCFDEERQEKGKRSRPLKGRQDGEIANGIGAEGLDCLAKRSKVKAPTFSREDRTCWFSCSCSRRSGGQILGRTSLLESDLVGMVYRDGDVVPTGWR